MESLAHASLAMTLCHAQVEMNFQILCFSETFLPANLDAGGCWCQTVVLIWPSHSECDSVWCGVDQSSSG